MTPLIESIYQKYISIFYEIDNSGTWIDLSVVRYALRAALRELGEPTLGRSKEIVRLNDWLFEHAPDLAHDPHTDTAEAMIAAWVEGLERGRHEWRKLPRDVRWRLIANVVQQVKTSVAFDAHRPQWMTSARAAALTFGDGLWENVVERARWLNE